MKKKILACCILTILGSSCAERKTLAKSNTHVPVVNATADSIKISKQKQ